MPSPTSFVVKKGFETRSRSSGATPGPRSATEIRTKGPVAVTPSGGVASTVAMLDAHRGPLG